MFHYIHTPDLIITLFEIFRENEQNLRNQICICTPQLDLSLVADTLNELKMTPNISRIVSEYTYSTQIMTDRPRIDH